MTERPSRKSFKKPARPGRTSKRPSERAPITPQARGRGPERRRAASKTLTLRGARARFAAIALGLSGTLALLAALLYGWGRLAGSGSPASRSFEVEATWDREELVARLHEAGLVAHPGLFGLHLALFRSRFAAATGRHWLAGDLSARDLARQLARDAGRPSARVVIPEGFQHRQIAARLEVARICSAEDFQRAVFEPSLLARLGLPGPSAEGYLFPATYELGLDSDAASVVSHLVREARTRLGKLQNELGTAFARADSRGLREHDLVILASVIEKEAGQRDEQPRIASVLMNRLTDSTFRPLRMLQSDPTAMYGCLVTDPRPSSCSVGPATPAMVRDSSNPYNTYRHPGLPPGPICNPGESALRAALEPEQTDFLYFFARGGGRHHFSRTFEEHRNAIDGR